MILKSIFLLLFCCYIGKGEAYNVFFQNSGPTVLGANVTFAAVIRGPGVYTDENFIYMFHNEELNFYKEIFTRNRHLNFTVAFRKDQFKAGQYVFEVRVTKRHEMGIYSLYGYGRCTLILTDLLNGELRLFQDGIDKTDGVIIPNKPVNHTLIISDRELQFIAKHPTYAVVWHINCSIVAKTQEFSMIHTYYDSYNAHNIEVLVVIENEVHTTTSTTTTTTITTTTPAYSDIAICLNCGTIASRNDVHLNNNNLNVLGYKIAKKSGRLSNFKCSPITEGYTYGYYNHTLRVRREESNTSMGYPIKSPYPTTNIPRYWNTSATSIKNTTEPRYKNTTELRYMNITETRFKNVTEHRFNSTTKPSTTESYWNNTAILNPRTVPNSSSNSTSPSPNSSTSLTPFTGSQAVKPAYLKVVMNWLFRGSYSFEVSEIQQD